MESNSYVSKWQLEVLKGVFESGNKAFRTHPIFGALTV